MNINKISFLTIIVCILIATVSNAQCNLDDLATSSASSIPTGYNFLKSYKISGEADLEKLEFSYVLTKGTNYILTVKDLNKPIGTLVTLYDQQRNRIACSKIGTEIVSAISFPCNATGIYYIQYTFNPGAGRCGGASLAFKR